MWDCAGVSGAVLKREDNYHGKENFIIHNGKSAEVKKQKLTDSEVVKLHRAGNYVIKQKDKK